MAVVKYVNWHRHNISATEKMIDPVIEQSLPPTLENTSRPNVNPWRYTVNLLRYCNCEYSFSRGFASEIKYILQA